MAIAAPKESPDARIAALEAELAQVRAEMEEFAATVSHDLRAPLRHIISYAQMVQEDAGPLLNAEGQEFLATITGSARHMGLLLDGLAAMSKVGAAPLVMESMPLQDAVQEACDRLSSKYPQRVVDWQLPADLTVVLADAALLQLVLEQVMGNALKFTASRACALIEVNASPAEQAGHICLRVQDNGVGFNPAMQAKLFRVFGRLHSAQQFDGIGMGLVLARKRVQRMGGTLAIEGVVDGGCRVTLTMPLAPD
jgi:light-regulated signal transduction histidine kinase (bacteriophytochrome)